MLRMISKIAFAGAIVGLAFVGSSGDTFAKGAKADYGCVPGSVRVTKKTCGKWGCHYQRCWWTGAQATWNPSPAFCVAPWCPKY